MFDFLSVLKSLWTVWALALFVGIVVWAYWPSRKRELEALGRIPLDDGSFDERGH